MKLVVKWEVHIWAMRPHPHEARPWDVTGSGNYKGLPIPSPLWAPGTVHNVGTIYSINCSIASYKQSIIHIKI